jgi:hypothetical protein
VDLRGLQKILSRRGKEFLVYKLVQNGFVQARLWPTRRKAEGLADYVADASRVPGSDSLDAAEISKIMLEELERRKASTLVILEVGSSQRGFREFGVDFCLRPEL